MSPGTAGPGGPRGRGRSTGLVETAREGLASLAGAVASPPPVRREWMAALAVGLAALVLLLVFAGQPLLYAAKTGAITPSHEDVRATGGLSRNDGALVLPEWASSLNLTGPVTLDIRLGDLDAASADLEAYIRSGRSLDGLVFRLDMTDTDILAFQQNNSANMASLERLLNQSEEFGRLGALELQYRDGKDAAMLKSVQLQGEELRQAVRQNYRSYAARKDGIVNLSHQYGLNTTAYEQSVLDFEAIAAAIGAIQDVRETSVPETIRAIQQGAGQLPQITFEVVPDAGAYGDRLSMQGRVTAPAGTEVTIFSDGLPLAGVVTGADGRFAFPFRIERIEAGRHTAYASAAAAFSEERTFSVDERNTTIDLAAELKVIDGNLTAICTGSLLTEDRVPVRDALVEVYVDEWYWNDGYTAENGSYEINLTYLERGRHNLTARYYPDGLPLNWSESDPVVIEVTNLLDLLLPLLYLAGLGGAAVGAVLYLRRRRALPLPPRAQRAGPPPEPVVVLPPAPTVEEAAAAAAVLEAGVDGREAVTRLYRRLARELDARHPGEFLLSLTPRELASRFAGAAAGDALARLVGIHERVRYAGHEPTEEDMQLVRESFVHVISESGSH